MFGKGEIRNTLIGVIFHLPCARRVRTHFSFLLFHIFSIIINSMYSSSHNSKHKQRQYQAKQARDYRGLAPARKGQRTFDRKNAPGRGSRETKMEDFFVTGGGKQKKSKKEGQRHEGTVFY